MEQNFRSPQMSIWLLAFFAVLVASANATGIKLDRSTYKGCVQRCSKDNSLFSSSRLNVIFPKARTIGQEQNSVQFEFGKTYSYRVNTWNEAQTIYALNKHQNSRDKLISVQAAVLLTPISDCELSLQLRNIKLHLKDGQSFEGQPDVDEFIRQLEVPILFGYQKGVVFEVCTDSNEDSFALNLKKSIISAFQITPNLSSTERVKVIESDVNGECETEYCIEKKPWNKFLVTKRKNLNKCENPAEQVETYRNWKNTLLKHNTNSVAECTQTIHGQQIHSAQCQSVRPINTVFPHFTVQLVSTVEIEGNEVVSAEQHSAQVPSRWTRHAHRLMMAKPSSQNSHYQQHLDNMTDLEGPKQLRKVLLEICDDIQTNGRRVSLKTGQLVHTLANTLKQFSGDVVSVRYELHNLMSICDESKKLKDIFVDTAASIMNLNTALIVRDELVKHINKAKQEQGQFSLKRARYLATLVAFSFEPTAEAVQEIVPELLEKVNDAQIVLSLSTLVKKTRGELNDVQLLDSLYQTVLKKVSARYSPGDDEFKYDQEAEIVRLLNALENIEPRFVVSGQEQLVKLISNKRLFESVRVAAIKSVQHIKMQAQLRLTLFKIFTDRSEPNEMRIAAYRTLAQSHATVPELRQILTVTLHEQNVDVRNYVCSHQKNLRTTSDLKKRALLPLDAPHFPEPQSIANFLVSRNFEYSFVDPKTKAGAIVEADLIMENDSRVPRAVIFNLTVPVAEQQIPIVQLTIRQQGLERSLIEQIDKLKQLKSPAVMFQKVRRMMQYQYDQQGKLQVLINVDGKNVYVWDSVDHKKEHQNEQYDTILAQLYKQLPIQIDETMVMMPLKHRVRLPTSNGIPINFELNTTLITSFETIIKRHQSAENLLEMHIKPTLVAELGVGLEADLQFEDRKNERVQFLNRFITAPTLHIEIEKKPKTRQLRVKILMPENEQTIAKFETLYSNEQDDDLVLLNALAESGVQNDPLKVILQEKRQPQWFNGTNKVHVNCLPVLDQVLGFTYCVNEFSVDDLKAALICNISRKTIFLSEIQLVKTDLQMEGIEFGMELPKLFTSESTLDKLKFVFHFDTPNSKVNRRINTELVVCIPQQQTDKYLVQVVIDSPVKKFSGQVVVLNQAKQMEIKIELTTDRQQRLFLLEGNVVVSVQDLTNSKIKIQLRVQPTDQSMLTQLEGEFVVNVQSETKKKVQLRFLANEEQVLDILLIQAGSLFQPIDLKMSTYIKVNLLGAEIESNALLNKNQQTGTIMSTGSLKYNRFLIFQQSRNTFESIDYHLQYSGFNQQITKQMEVKKFFRWTFQSSQFPRINQEFTYNIMGQVPDEFVLEMNFKWSTEVEGKRVHIFLESKQFENYPLPNMKRQSQFVVEITPLYLHYDIQMILDEQQKSIETRLPMTYVIELKVANRKTSEVPLEARLDCVVSSKNLLQTETQGEIKIRGGKHVFLYRDNLKEVSIGVYQGITLIEMVESSKISPSMPKKIQLSYTLKMLHGVFASRLSYIDPLYKEYVLDQIAYLVNSLAQFKNELIVETKAFGQIQHTGLVTINEKNELQLKSHLQLEQPMFTAEIEIMSNSSELRSLNVKFESDKLNQLQLEAKLEGEQKHIELKMEDQRMKHQIRFDRKCAFGMEQQWSIMAESLNKDEGKKWIIQSEHQCYQFTLLQLDTPLVRGIIEVRVDSNQIHIDLKGDQQWQGFEHKTDAQIDVDADKLMIKSATLRQGKPFVFVDAELYITVDRNSTLKLEIEPLEFKSYIQANPKFGAELQLTAQKWLHQTKLKKRFSELIVQSETRKDGEIVMLIEAELAPKKVQLKELALNRFSPISVKGKFDLKDREMQLQVHSKQSDRFVKMEAKMKDLKNVHLEVKWDAARNQSKRLLFQIRVQDKETEPERLIASIRSDIIDQSFEVEIDVPRTLNQLIQGYHQMDVKLKINLFNAAGRQLELKVDLVRPLQKKLQIESFAESISTVDIESTHGKNSQLAIELSFQQEKKMELSISWFGQWRRNFKLEALLKGFSNSSIEMLITSRHSVLVDEMDGLLKEYVGQWVRKFYKTKKYWNTQTLIQMNGVKKIDLQVECATKQMEEDRAEMVLKANLTGVRQATGLLTVIIRRLESNPLGMIEMIQWKLANQHEQVMSFDFFLGLRDVHQSGNRTEVKLAAQNKTIFGLTHITNNRVNGQNSRASMLLLELSDQIEYVLHNEIEYQQNQNQSEQIKSIRSELKRKQNTVQSIYQTRIIFDEDEQRDLKVMHVEIQSDRFNSSAYFDGLRTPIIVEIRYNFSPKQCMNISHGIGVETKKLPKFITDSMPTECWRIEVLIGQTQNQQQQQPQQDKFELQSEQNFDIKIGANYIKNPIDSRHSNRTIRFDIESFQNELNRTDLMQPINITLIGHFSLHAIGVQWENRYGQHWTNAIQFSNQYVLDDLPPMFKRLATSEGKYLCGPDLAFWLHIICSGAPKNDDELGNSKGEALWWNTELLSAKKSPVGVRSRVTRGLDDDIITECCFKQCAVQQLGKYCKERIKFELDL